MAEKFLYKNITEKIIRCFYNVYDYLGPGFLENVYQNAIIIELEDLNLKIEKQKAIKVYYQN